MRILVLMPCDERSVYEAMNIYKHLSNKAKDCCIMMPAFIDNLVQIKLVNNWTQGLFWSLLAASKALQVNDSIVFGNVSKDFGSFDEIYNFQMEERDAEYKDFFIEKVKDVVKEEETLFKLVNNLYTQEDSTFTLHDSAATGEFISKIFESDNKEKLQELKEKYKKLNFKE